jgi:hypothetical protein
MKQNKRTLFCLLLGLASIHPCFSQPTTEGEKILLTGLTSEGAHSQAYIKIGAGKAQWFDEGETIGSFTVVKIDAPKNEVLLRDKSDVTRTIHLENSTVGDYSAKAPLSDLDRKYSSLAKLTYTDVVAIKDIASGHLFPPMPIQGWEMLPGLEQSHTVSAYSAWGWVLDIVTIDGSQYLRTQSKHVVDSDNKPLVILWDSNATTYINTLVQ